MLLPTSCTVLNRIPLTRNLVNKFGGKDLSQRRTPKNKSDSKATLAIVSINIAVQGDGAKLPTIQFRQNLRDAMSQIASQAKGSLLSAEIVWAPEDSSETLTADDVYADFPDLIPL